MGKDAENNEGTLIDYVLNQLDIIIYMITTDNKNDALLYINWLYKYLKECNKDSSMYNENKFDFTEDDYVDLYDKFMESQMLTTPDAYQMKQNDLTRYIAEFLLKPYMKRCHENRFNDDD